MRIDWRTSRSRVIVSGLADSRSAEPTRRMDDTPKRIEITVSKRMAFRRVTKALAKTYGYTSAEFVAVLTAAEPVPVDGIMVVLRDPPRRKQAKP